MCFANFARLFFNIPWDPRCLTYLGVFGFSTIKPLKLFGTVDQQLMNKFLVRSLAEAAYIVTLFI